MKHFLRLIGSLSLFIASVVCYATEFEDKLIWTQTTEVANGIQYKHLTLTEPRLLNMIVARIDLKNPQLRLEATGRDELWGQPMPDYPSLTVCTKRKTVTSFLKQARENGKNMLFAINTCAWGPWTSPYNHKYGGKLGLVISNGVLVSHSNGRPTLVIYKDGRIAIERFPKDADTSAIEFAIAGFADENLVKDGVPQKHGNDLAPRMCIGISQDCRYLFILAVDGRNKKESIGASLTELGQWLKAMGAFNGINLDGGGSTTVACWNSPKEAVEKLNLATCGTYCRPVACSLGFIIEPEQESQNTPAPKDNEVAPAAK